MSRTVETCAALDRFLEWVGQSEWRAHAQMRLVRSVELAEQRTDVRDLPRLDDQPVAECANTGGLHPVEPSQRRGSAGA